MSDEIRTAIEDVKDAFIMWQYDRECPGEDWSDVHRSRDLAVKALKRYSETKPRIMTRGEVEHCIYGRPYIIEIDAVDDGATMKYGLFLSEGLAGNFDFQTTAGLERLQIEAYGIKWRIWTACPSDEERNW